MSPDPSPQEPTTPRRIRVLLVDDSPAVLRQVAQVLPDDFEIVDRLDNGDALHVAVEASHPDVIVLDITLPGRTGIVLASELRRANCPARIVFLTVHDDVDYVRSARAAGACGYVLKPRMLLDLEPALRAAFVGQRFVSPVQALEID